MDARVCPNCNSRDTYRVSEAIGKEIRDCEGCGEEYEVLYDIKIKEVKSINS